MSKLSVVLHDIRSTHNVGAILRTCDGFGINTVYIGGYTPYPLIAGDSRLPHISAKLTKEIAKTALGAEKTVKIVLYPHLAELIQGLKKHNIRVIALEQSSNSVKLNHFKTDGRDMALLLGREVEGIDREMLDLCDHILEIPMHGQKESFNVSVSAGIAMYTLTL